VRVTLRNSGAKAIVLRGIDSEDLLRQFAFAMTRSEAAVPYTSYGAAVYGPRAKKGGPLASQPLATRTLRTREHGQANIDVDVSRLFDVSERGDSYMISCPLRGSLRVSTPRALRFYVDTPVLVEEPRGAQRR